MSRRGLSALLLCAVAALSLAKTALLAEIAERLVTGEQLQGRFEQEKSLPFLTRPLRSSGEFSLASGRGLRWRVLQPVVSEMTVDGSGVQLDGRAVQDRGVGELIAQLMGSFMAGDLAALEDGFSVSGALRDEGWELVLVPRSVLLQSALEEIRVWGDAYLQRVEVTESGGTVTVIRLLGVSVTDPGASPGHVAR